MDALKVNSTLTSLDLEKKLIIFYDDVRLHWHELIMDNAKNDNQIGDSGAFSIGDVLKVNSTLSELDLSMRRQ